MGAKWQRAMPVPKARPSLVVAQSTPIYDALVAEIGLPKRFRVKPLSFAAIERLAWREKTASPRPARKPKAEA